MALYFDPNFVDLVEQIDACRGHPDHRRHRRHGRLRASKLADDYTKAERARINLARHFSPNVVDELATTTSRSARSAGRTSPSCSPISSASPPTPRTIRPEQVFQMLREFHRRMEQVVFEHRGTVDNYIGDCIMATFGVPRAAPDDAARALRAARGMIASLDDWNRQRAPPA